MESFHGCGGKTTAAAAVGLLPKKTFHKKGNIPPALAERRNINGKRVDAIEQIIAKAAAPHLRSQVLVGCGNDADIDSAQLRSTYSFHFSGLYQSEQRRLGLKRQFADFVKKNGTAVGQLKLSGMPFPGRTGKRTLNIPEQLTLKQTAGNGAAVHSNKGLSASCTGIVNGLSEQFLTRSAFAVKKSRNTAFRCGMGQLKGSPKFGRLTDNGIKRISCDISGLLCHIYAHLLGTAQT